MDKYYNLLFVLIDELNHSNPDYTHKLMSEKISRHEIYIVLKVFLKLGGYVASDIRDIYSTNLDYILNIPTMRELYSDMENKDEFIDYLISMLTE